MKTWITNHVIFNTHLSLTHPLTTPTHLTGKVKVHSKSIYSNSNINVYLVEYQLNIYINTPPPFSLIQSLIIFYKNIYFPAWLIIPDFRYLISFWIIFLVCYMKRSCYRRENISCKDRLEISMASQKTQVAMHLYWFYWKVRQWTVWMIFFIWQRLSKFYTCTSVIDLPIIFF